MKHPFVQAAFLATLSTLGACGSSGNSTTALALPYGNFACDGRTSLSVQRNGQPASIAVLGPDGDQVALTASPPGQAARFSSGGTVFLVEGPEALWMKSGEVPLNCIRR